MLKVFSAKQLHQLDTYTITNEPIKSIDLMERAASQLFNWIKDNLMGKANKGSFSIFCGSGNNGGDGLAIARMLLEEGHHVKVYIVELSNNYSTDFKTNLKRYKGEKFTLSEKSHDFSLQEKEIIVDAIFGSGLNRPISGFAAAIIKQLNASSHLKIAIDMPSGLFAEDNSDNDITSIFKANITLSIQLPKLAFLFPENSVFVGNWQLIDIGLSGEFIEQTESDFNYYLPRDCTKFLKSRAAFSHKGSYGHALIFAGSKGKMGAAILAAKACLRSGVGLLTMRLPQLGEHILQTAVPEAMVEADNNESILSEFKNDLKYSAIGLGPGIGTANETQQMFKLLIQQVNSPMVIDADGITILAENKTWLSFLPKASILTPHPGEFKRLVGEWKNDFERLQLQINLAKKHSVYIILKGKNTSIATPFGKVFFNSTGNPGMATGGSGDVLTGMLTSFLAQGYSPLETCLLGVCLHGLAGDFAAEKRGMESMLAADIVDGIADAFFALKDKSFTTFANY
ncbi:MAG: NAD(P)H-hydrate dehydratase [Vicingaceae bacterium]